MNEEILAKLKIKPIPKTKESIEIKVKKPASEKEEIMIKTKIIDKTDEKLVNRKDFLIKIFGTKQSLSKDDTIKEKKPDERVELESTQIVQNPIKLKERLILEPSSESLQIKDKTSKTPSLKPKTIAIKKRTTKSPIGIALEGPSSQLIIGDEIIKNRLPVSDSKIIVRAPNYYMNNREIFINFITSLFGEYKDTIEQDEKDMSCSTNTSNSFNMLTHQKIVRDYINIYTPYRGLLLYHGLGSGKTCSSIGIAEGLKDDKKVIILTPASLRMNYLEELKKCGDLLYKKVQFWEFINTTSNPELAKNLSYVLSLPVAFINKNKGAWLVNIKKQSNYDILSTQEKISLDLQITEMIKNKYRFINYNGLRNSNLQNMTANYTINPFDNTTVVIDEAHNLVSRIVNKINKSKGKEDKKEDIKNLPLALKLYEYLMSAENARIILLTGTPIINYPNEISILFNILRGKIKLYKFKLIINEGRIINQDFISKLLKSNKNLKNFIDNIDYQPSSTTLSITENPFGFSSEYNKTIYEGVHKNTSDQNLTSKEFIKLIVQILKQNDINIIPGGIQIELFKALPDKLDDFKKYFIDDKNKIKNENLFKRRVLGLTSYFPDIDALLPKFEKGLNYHIIKIEMSDFQFGVYEEARVQERKLELANSKQKKSNINSLYEYTSLYIEYFHVLFVILFFLVQQ